VAACPYDARYIDQAIGKVDKCDFCAERVQKGLDPACVLTCPTKAKTFGDLEDISGTLFKTVYYGEAKRVQSSSAEIGPNVYYEASQTHFSMAASAFAPHAPRTIAATKVWGAVVEKLVFLAIGATFLGQAVAFFRQLAVGEHQFEE
jgi:tetrathionate reductase subunit B